MAVADWLRRFFGQLGDAPDLATAALTGGLVPPDSSYVTVGAVTVLTDARQFLGGDPGTGPYGADLGWLPAPVSERPTAVSLLVLATNTLRVIDRGGEHWSVRADRIVALDGHRRSGFVVVTTGRDGLAVGTPSPVEVPPGAGWRTVTGMTDLFAGWDAALAPYGARVHW